MAQNPANLPSYEHPDYVQMKPALQLLLDSYEGLFGRKAEYLPKAQKEPEKAYERRVERSVFNNKLRPIVDSNAGLLTAFDVSGMPPSLEQAEDNVDMQGTGFKSFVYNANILGLRDRSCFILTMQEPGEEGRTLADDLQNPRRPYWKLIDRRNVLNWRVRYQGGQPILEQVTVLLYEDVDDGLYGYKAEPRYHRLKKVADGVEVAIFTINEKGEVDQAEPPRTVPIERIPLRSYPDATDPFSTAMPSFLKAAELNIKLFRQESSLDNIQYRVNAPTFWRRSSMEMKDRPPFIAGENYVIELMSGDGTAESDDVGVLEINGAGIAAMQQSIAETKSDIDAEQMGFVSGAAVERTATEAYLSGAQVAASLNGKARQMSAALKGIVEDWCLFTSENPSQFAVEMDHSVLEQPLDAAEMSTLLGLWQAGAIDHRTLLELLRMGRQLPPSADIDEILQRVEDEAARQMAALAMQNGILEPAQTIEVSADAAN
ncbi:MAG: DUF4055 domain-containing protein [Cyanobacteria bacterium J06554_6]